MASRIAKADRASRSDIVRKRGNKWLVLTESGDRVLGEHDTEAAAMRQLGAIEASMARNDVPAKYSHISFKPPQGVRSAAKRGLEFRGREGGGGGTGVGVARARDLSGGKNISPETARRMASFFARHQGGSRKIDPKFKGEPWRDRGYVAWLLWGGDAGRSWADKLVRQMNAADKRDTTDRSNRVDFVERLRLDAMRIEETSGFLTVYARLTRTGVFDYEDANGARWGELRTPQEVFSPESIKSFEGVVVTNDHPDSFVNTGNVRDLQVGHVGTDVRREGDYLCATVTITDPDTIRAVRDGKVEVSCGYTAEVIPDKGTFEGQEYSAKQTRIRGNHLAIVDEGRAGPGARLLLDAAHSVRKDKETEMENTEKKDAMVAVGGREYEVDEAVADHIQGLQADFDEVREELRKMRGSMNDTEDMSAKSKDGYESEDMREKLVIEDMKEEMTVEDGASAMRARVDALEAQLAAARSQEAGRIDARVGLVSKAREILGAKFDHSGKSDQQIQRAVVLAVLPSMAERLERNREDAGYLRSAYDTAVDHHIREQESITDSLRVTFDAAQGNGAASVQDDYDAYLARTYGKAGK